MFASLYFHLLSRNNVWQNRRIPRRDQKPVKVNINFIIAMEVHPTSVSVGNLTRFLSILIFSLIKEESLTVIRKISMMMMTQLN